MTKPLPLVALRTIVEASLMHQLTSPYLSFSLQQFICSPFTYVVIIVCVPSSSLLPSQHHFLLCASPSICSPICSHSLLFTSFSISSA